MSPRVRLTAELLEQTACIMTADEKYFDVGDLHPEFLRWIALQMMSQCEGMHAHFHRFEPCEGSCTDTAWDWLSRKPLWLAITSRVTVPHPIEILLEGGLDEYRPDAEYWRSDTPSEQGHDTDSDGTDGSDEPAEGTPPVDERYCDEPPF